MCTSVSLLDRSKLIFFFYWNDGKGQNKIKSKEYHTADIQYPNYTQSIPLIHKYIPTPFPSLMQAVQ